MINFKCLAWTQVIQGSPDINSFLLICVCSIIVLINRLMVVKLDCFKVSVQYLYIEVGLCMVFKFESISVFLCYILFYRMLVKTFTKMKIWCCTGWLLYTTCRYDVWLEINLYFIIQMTNNLFPLPAVDYLIKEIIYWPTLFGSCTPWRHKIVLRMHLLYVKP